MGAMPGIWSGKETTYTARSWLEPATAPEAAGWDSAEEPLLMEVKTTKQEHCRCFAVLREDEGLNGTVRWARKMVIGQVSGWMEFWRGKGKWGSFRLGCGKSV